MSRPVRATTIRFILTNADSIEPVLEVKLPSSIVSAKEEICHCVNLKDYGIQLEPDIQYRWFISVDRNSDSYASDMVAGGMIERCTFDDCLLLGHELPLDCAKESVMAFARTGLWYDSISCLCDLIKSNPTDESLRQYFHSLMRQGGLRIPGPESPNDLLHFSNQDKS
jgi:hypothetical protein